MLDRPGTLLRRDPERTSEDELYKFNDGYL